MALPPAPELALPLCAPTSPPLPPPGVATPSWPRRPFSLNGSWLSTPLVRHTARSSVTSPSSSLGTLTLASPQLFLTLNAWPESCGASSESLVILSPSPSSPSPSPYPSSVNSSVPFQRSVPPDTTVRCSVPLSALPLHASSVQVSSLGKHKALTTCSWLALSPLPLTSPLRLSPSWPARLTPFGRVLHSLCRPSSSALVPSLLSMWCAGHGSLQHPSSSSRATGRLTGLASSPPCADALQPAGSNPRPTLTTPSAMVRQHGRPQMALTMTPSVGLGAGRATASVATLSNLLPTEQPPPRWRSTLTPRLLCCLTLLPGTTSDCLSWMGSPLLALQPQLMTITLCGTPLAHHVAMAGSSQATLPS
ncbi:uncharacterized protein UBRO_20266 [Ustilago bromivora]|uniref:Uncharacterized protein n=1 Tax=Ustilago bromivora TaxID=307758 RepID=A0A1K0GLM1_9BASI|nr:uncharacterized protein UBRO_20266 [Ustilago bromivora]